jgi:hypothetical protein
VAPRDGLSDPAEDIPMPVEGGILEWTGHPNRPEVLLLVATWTDAPQVYRYDGHAATLANTGLALRSPVDYGDVDAPTLQVPARDGTLIRSRSSTARAWRSTATTRPCSPGTAPMA